LQFDSDGSCMGEENASNVLHECFASSNAKSFAAVVALVVQTEYSAKIVALRQ